MVPWIPFRLTGQKEPYGCDFLRALEINHKNCDRKKLERLFKKPESSYSFYKRIVDGDRPTGDLVVCGVCNKNHYFQRKFGLKWQVIYDCPKFQSEERMTKSE